VVSVGSTDVGYLCGPDMERLAMCLAGTKFMSAGMFHVQSSLIRKFNSSDAAGIEVLSTNVAGARTPQSHGNNRLNRNPLTRR
jgi:hypothetical protein